MEQAEVTEGLRLLLGDVPPRQQALLRRVHGNAGVARRGFVLPAEEYLRPTGFGARQHQYVAAGSELALAVAEEALGKAGVDADQVDLVMTVSTTGVAAPSLDARIAGALGLRHDVRRVPVFGLGCVAGAAGVARCHDWLLGRPDAVALLLSVELCSLTLQRSDASVQNLVASALFGDGAAAVVLAGDDVPVVGPALEVLDSASHLYPDTETVMGWDVTDDGFRIMLDAGIPELARTHAARDVSDLLSAHGHAVDDVRTWLVHPGGPRVLDAVVDALGLSEDDVSLTRRSLRENGNISSASVLQVLAATLAERPREAGATAMMLALGPGFCSEAVLLAWT